MDDLPSRAADSSSGAQASERGIYDLGLRFAVIYREIARGVTDAMGRRRDRDEWWDLVQEIAPDAWRMYRRNPECFATESARRWASHAARNRRSNRKRSERRHAIQEQALQREYLAGNFDAKPVDQEIEEQERRRAIAKALQLLKPQRRWAVIEVFFRRRSYREAAAELGVSERAIKRSLEEARPDLAVELSVWNSRASRTATKRGDHE
jgi:RNA polymerase sigma factor (sigma-70 family)